MRKTGGERRPRLSGIVKAFGFQDVDGAALSARHQIGYTPLLRVTLEIG